MVEVVVANFIEYEDFYNMQRLLLSSSLIVVSLWDLLILVGEILLILLRIRLNRLIASLR